MQNIQGRQTHHRGSDYAIWPSGKKWRKHTSSMSDRCPADQMALKHSHCTINYLSLLNCAIYYRITNHMLCLGFWLQSNHSKFASILGSCISEKSGELGNKDWPFCALLHKELVILLFVIFVSLVRRIYSWKTGYQFLNSTEVKEDGVLVYWMINQERSTHSYWPLILTITFWRHRY